MDISVSLKQKKIGVLLGGYSLERAVSLKSGQNVYNALLECGYNVVKIDPAVMPIQSSGIEAAFNCLHGVFGEDGTVQSYLERLGIPYTGSGPQASMICLNKWVSKQIFLQHHIPTPPCHMLMADQFDRHTRPDLPFPLIVKPINQGSSLGIEVLDTFEDYQRNVPALLDQYTGCLIETFLEGQEISVGVITIRGVLTPLPILELCPKNRFYDYEAKYTPGMTTFILPARLSEALTHRCQALALQTHQVMGCRGYSRVDMMIANNEPMVLEVNTSPGMTALSDLPAQALQAGISYPQLVEFMLESAFV